MAKPPKLTKSTVNVLQFLLANANESHHGFALMRETGVGSGTLYPLLDRLKHEGWLKVDDEETKNETHPGRPPRRFYSLTPLGQTAATEALERKTSRNGQRVGGPIVA